MDIPWRVIQCYSGKEIEVSHQANQLGAEALAPLGKVRRFPRGGRGHSAVIVDRPIFTGYVLCRYTDLDMRSRLLECIPNAYGWLRFGNFQATVTADEIASVELMLAASAQCSARPRLIKGQRVRIVDESSCMYDQVGEYIEERGAGVFAINFVLFNRAVTMPVSWDILEPVKDAVAA